MAEIVWTLPARDDLADIHKYIARDSVHYAQLTIERIISATWRLEQFAKTGGRLDEFPDSAYRQIFWGNYRIIYREEETEARVYIIGVIHGSRDFASMFAERREQDRQEGKE